MAKVKSNVLVRGISGMIGKSLVFRQMPDGSTVVSERPDFSRRKFSARQLTHQSRFQQAAAYARQAARTQPIYAKLAAGTGKTAYNIALSDWFNPPVIHRIERLDGGRIRVQASDHVKVAKVEVAILDEEGMVIEKGDAQELESGAWEYVCEAEGKVRAEAWDLAGNRVERIVDGG